MKIKQILAFLAALLAAIPAFSDEYPTISPTATYTDSSGSQHVEQAGGVISEQAPLTVRFEANPQNTAGLVVNYQWSVYLEADTVPHPEGHLYRFQRPADQLLQRAHPHHHQREQARLPQCLLAQWRRHQRHLQGQGGLSEHRRVPGHHLQPVGTENLLVGRPLGRMGRNVQRQAREGRHLLRLCESQGSRRPRIPYPPRCEPVAGLFGKQGSQQPLVRQPTRPQAIWITNELICKRKQKR